MTNKTYKPNAKGNKMTKKSTEEKVVETIVEAVQENTPVVVVEQKKPATIEILFTWQMCTPDPRPYKPGGPVLSPQGVLNVGVDVPLTVEFIKNANVVLTAQLTSGNVVVPDPVLTVIGMRYCMDQFETAMSNPDTGKPHNEFAEEKKVTVAPKTEDAVKWDDDDNKWPEDKTEKTDKNVDWDDTENWN